MITINETIARKVLTTVDAGLSHGLGNQVAGEMCVEATVCYALDLPHGDDPGCVSMAVRALKINLNDRTWSSNAARAKGLRRLALAQLGSKDAIDDRNFAKRVAELAIRKSVPAALRVAASIQKDPVHREAMIAAAFACEKTPDRDTALMAKKTADAGYAANAAAYAAYAANAAAYAAYAADAGYAANAAADAAYAANAAADAARDKSLAEFAEDVVQILISMNAPGCQWLSLTEAA